MEANYNQMILALTVVLLPVAGMGTPAFAVLVNGVDETTLGTLSPQAVVSQQACNDIDYTFTGTGSGNLGATNFVDSDFTIRVWSNTCDVVEVSPGIFNVGDLMAEVEVDGVGTATVTEETGVFVGFSDSVGWGKFIGNINQGDIYDLFDVGVAASGYDLTTDFGPVFDADPLGFLTSVSTDSGDFFVNGAITDGSFKAELKIEPVGGELLPIDNTALLLAGIQSSAIWMLPVLAGAAGAAFGALYIRTKRN